MHGFCWHEKHDILLTWCLNYDGRVLHIEHWKPPEEQGLRLRLFQPVRGQLPEPVIKARDAWEKAGDACNKARADVYIKTKAAYEWAWAAYLKAIEENMPAIEELHRQECPNCPWDGETIFSKETDG